MSRRPDNPTPFRSVSASFQDDHGGVRRLLAGRRGFKPRRSISRYDRFRRTLRRPRVIGHRLKMAIHDVTGGLTASVGLSSTKYVAKVASAFRKPDGLTVVPPEGAKAWLAPLPVSRLWGVGPKTQDRLHQLGFLTIGSVAEADPQFFPPSSGAPAFTSTLWRMRKTRDPCLARECQRALGQKTRLIWMSARRQTSSFTCGDQPM